MAGMARLWVGDVLFNDGSQRFALETIQQSNTTVGNTDIRFVGVLLASL